MTWELPVDSGFHYLLRLHFCEIDKLIYFVGQRRFIIYIDYLLAELGANVILWIDERVMPFYRDYVVKIQKKGVEDNNHVLSIDLHPDTGATSDGAILNGVEVFKLSNSPRRT